jgi:hypothetical protein
MKVHHLNYQRLCQDLRSQFIQTGPFNLTIPLAFNYLFLLLTYTSDRNIVVIEDRSM